MGIERGRERERERARQRQSKRERERSKRERERNERGPRESNNRKNGGNKTNLRIRGVQAEDDVDPSVEPPHIKVVHDVWRGREDEDARVISGVSSADERSCIY